MLIIDFVYRLLVTALTTNGNISMFKIFLFYTGIIFISVVVVPSYAIMPLLGFKLFGYYCFMRQWRLG